jgi:salicylate hydroxylase
MVKHCEPDDVQPTLVLADGERVSADIVIGADGVHSTLRRALFREDAPEFTGFVAYRGLVPRDHLPALDSPAPSGLTIGPGRSFLRYLIRRGDILNYVAFVNTTQWEQEGWSVACERSELEDHFRGAHADVQRVLEATPGSMLHKWGLFSRPALASWTRGRVTLLGDAAHPMLPFLGQGASMAMEDGCVIARAIAGAGTPDDALRSYEALRITRANAVAAASSARAEAIHSGDPAAYSRHVAKPGVASRQELFDYDATQVPLDSAA